MKSGDQNNAYFHHKANQRGRRDEIKGLKDEDRVWKMEEKENKRIVTNYFRDLFSIGAPCDMDMALVGVRKMVTEEMN